MSALTWRLALGGLTLAGCLIVIFIETEGLRVLTSARQPAVRALQHPLFELPLRDSNGQLVSALPAAGALRVVEITYERCRTICTVQGGSLSEVFRALHDEIDARRLHLVSLSVDAGDCPAGIARRVRRLSGGARGWDGLCVRDGAALALLTQRIGVVAIREEIGNQRAGNLGDYRHTEGIFIVAANGRVMTYEPSLNKQTLVLAIQDALQVHRGGGGG